MAQLILEKKHIPSLNLLRGLAAVSVACFHILSPSFNNYPYIKAIIGKGYLGLDLFFVISGFIIPYSLYQNKYPIKYFHKFFLKRSVRVEPPYIISFILIIGLQIFAVYMHNKQYGDGIVYKMDWTKFGLHFFYLNQYFGYESYTVVYWTLAIEFQFYILMGLLFPLIISHKKIIPIILLLGFCSLVWVLNLHYNWFIFQYGYLFVMGILVFLYMIKRITLLWFTTLISLVFVLTYFKNGLDTFLIGIFACISIITIKREWRLPNFLGKISFSFYLLHCEIAGWFIFYLSSKITNDIFLRILSLLFAFVVSIGFYFLFERPAFILSKRIGYKK